MLTLQYERYCYPDEIIQKTLSQNQVLGCAGKVYIISVQQGSAQLEAQQVVKAGEILVVGAPCTLHPIERCVIQGVRLAGDCAQELFAQLAVPVVVSQSDCLEMRPLLERMVEDEKAMSDAQKSALAYTMLCHLTQKKGQEMPDIVMQAMAEMRENYAQMYGIEEIAQELGVSKNHLIRTFTATVGISPGKYLTGVRIEAAKRFLLKDGYTLDTVANLCGFSCANYLCKVFKSAVGQTPNAWRRRMASQALVLQEDENEQQVYL